MSIAEVAPLITDTARSKHELPCWQITREVSDFWFSRHQASRELAARICLTECPAINECAHLADTNHETTGVWGGIDRTRKRTHRG